MCIAKKRVKRDDNAEEWKIDTLEEDDIQPSAMAPRFFNIAKRNLGYTHTEAGLRTLCQIDDEMRDLNKIIKERDNSRENDELSWIFDGEEGE